MSNRGPTYGTALPADGFGWMVMVQRVPKGTHREWVQDGGHWTTGLMGQAVYRSRDEARESSRRAIGEPVLVVWDEAAAKERIKKMHRYMREQDKADLANYFSHGELRKLTKESEHDGTGNGRVSDVHGDASG